MVNQKEPKRGKSNRRPRSKSDTKGVSSHLSTQSRAPVPHSAPTKPRVPRAFRIGRIVDLMVGQQWVRGVTAHELAAEWGMPVATVETDSSDAGKFIELCLDPAEVRRHSMVHLRRIAESGEPVAVRAIEIALKATGNLTERVDVSVSTRTTPDMFAAALEHEGFRAYLLEQGWRPPKCRPVLTTGTAAP